MSAVYKICLLELDRIVALKILPPAIVQSPEFSERFTREAKALAKLNHPGIVTLHEFVQQNGLYFIVMEFVDGMNLAQLMRTSRISPREALAIVLQICDTLQFAHDQGIVHRGIKPENILLDVRLDEVVLKAMEKDPESRYKQASVMKTMLDDIPTPASDRVLEDLTGYSIPQPPQGMIRRWWWMFLVMIPVGFVLGLAAGFTLNHFFPKKYDVQTVIEIKNRHPDFNPPDFFRVQSEKIKSAEVLATVANRLKLKTQWRMSEEEVIRQLREIITVQNIRGTDLISIQVRYSSAQNVVNVAKTVNATLREQFDGDEMIIHEEPFAPLAPSSPNKILNLTLTTLSGLLLSPLMALMMIPILHRIFPKKMGATERASFEL